jgi:hypothetical protein
MVIPANVPLTIIRYFRGLWTYVLVLDAINFKPRLCFGGRHYSTVRCSQYVVLVSYLDYYEGPRHVEQCSRILRRVFSSISCVYWENAVLPIFLKCKLEKMLTGVPRWTARPTGKCTCQNYPNLINIIETSESTITARWCTFFAFTPETIPHAMASLVKCVDR